MTEETAETPGAEQDVTYEVCGRLGAHEPHVWLSDSSKNCTGSGEPGYTDPLARRKRRQRKTE